MKKQMINFKQIRRNKIRSNICIMWNSGFAIRRISYALQISRSTVRKWNRRTDLRSKPRACVKTKYKPEIAEKINSLMNDLMIPELGLSKRKVAKIINLELKQHNIILSDTGIIKYIQRTFVN